MKKFLLSIAMTSLVAAPSFAQDCPAKSAKGVCPVADVVSSKDDKAKPVAARSECCADKAKAQAAAAKAASGCPTAAKAAVAKAVAAKSACDQAHCDGAKAKPAASTSKKKKCTVNG